MSCWGRLEVSRVMVEANHVTLVIVATFKVTRCASSQRPLAPQSLLLFAFATPANKMVAHTCNPLDDALADRGDR